MMILLLLTVASCSDFKERLDYVRHTSLGKALLETLKVASEHNEPISNVINMIQDVQQSIHNEEQAANQRYLVEHERCEKSRHSILIQIRDLRSSQFELTSEVMSLRIHTNKLAQNLAHKQRDLEFLNQEILRIQDIRQQQVDSAYDRIESLSTLQFQLTEVKKLFIKFLQSSGWKTDAEIEKYFTFLERKTITFQSISNDIFNMRKNLQTSQAHKSMINQFAQLASRMADVEEGFNQNVDMSSRQKVEFMHETITSIMKACTHLYEYVSELKDIEEQHERMKQQAHEGLLTELINERTACQANIVFLTDSLESANIEFRAAIEDKNNVDERVERKILEFDNMKNECQAFMEGYEKDKKHREDQIQIIDQVIELVASSFGQLRKFLSHK